MAAAPPYIPNKDADLVTWTENYRAVVTATPAAYGLNPPDVTAIQNSADDFLAKYTLANNPATRTPVTVSEKNAARFAWKQLARTYSAQIRLNPGVSDSDKVSLGLNLPNFSPAPIPAPVSWPILTLIQGGPLVHQFSWKDSLTPTGKFKPTGVIQCQLVGRAAPTAGGSPDELPPLPAQTKAPFQLQWAPADSGKIATYYARWVTRRGLVGPWGPMVSAVIM